MLATVALAWVSAAARSQSPAGDFLAPDGLVAEHMLERRWSEGGAWGLLPAPEVPLRLHIRVGNNFSARAIRADGSEVLIIWVPQAAGTSTGSELVARLVTDRGWAVASLLPPADLPPPGSPIEAWIQLLEDRIRAGREMLRISKSESTHCIAVLGASAGAIAALRLAELEPEVDAVVAMLAGAGSGLQHAAQVYGASPDPAPSAMHDRIEALDPAKHAEALSGRPRLLIRARFDGAIPVAAFEELRAALGEPETWAYPSGHESFVYALPFAVDGALDWVGDKCGARTDRSEVP